MVIKTQPDLPKYAMQPMAIGEKLNLKFEVTCGRPVIYEWLKQGVREDVMTSPATSSVRAAITPVSNGRELVGEVVEGGEGITSWQYLCRAFCPSTGKGWPHSEENYIEKFFYSGESVYSNIIKLKVAKATTNECSFPKFKIALVICEEKYQKTAQFPSLKATRNDGEALISALQELQFQVLAFTNITLDQLRNAIELFTSFIDEETYALFYYNGHAVGHNEDIYLATVESSLGKQTFTPLIFNIDLLQVSYLNIEHFTISASISRHQYHQSFVFRRAWHVTTVPSAAPSWPCRVCHIREESPPGCHHLRLLQRWSQGFHQEEVGCLKAKFWIHYQKQSQSCYWLRYNGQHEIFRGERHQNWKQHWDLYETFIKPYQEKRSRHWAGIQKCSKRFSKVDASLDIWENEAWI